MKTGKLIVFEGIDDSGTSTQVQELAKEIEAIDKYQDILRTHEPWKSKEIKEKLIKDKDAYSGGEEIANLFVDDRARHTRELLRPNLKAGVIALCDRYIVSTCTYQWTQGVPLENLMQMHKDRGILIPDLTLFLDVPLEVAKSRREDRDSKEKFETDDSFIEKLIDAHHAIYHIANVNPGIFGTIVKINGDQSKGRVTKDILDVFKEHYDNWTNPR